MTLKKPVYNKDDISRNRKEAAVSLLRDVMKYLFLIFLLNTSLQAQKSFDLELNPIDQEVKFIKEKLTYRTKHISKKSIQNELKSIIENLHAQFYLTANIDSLTIQDSTYKAFIFVGQQFKWANLVKLFV